MGEKCAGEGKSALIEKVSGGEGKYVAAVVVVFKEQGRGHRK